MTGKTLQGIGVSGVGGVAALIIGLVLRAHYAAIHAACSSGLGVVGQAVNGSAQSQCSSAADFLNLAYALIFAGAIWTLCSVASIANIYKSQTAGTGWRDSGRTTKPPQASSPSPTKPAAVAVSEPRPSFVAPRKRSGWQDIDAPTDQ
jgi:hypothetical protein